MMTWQWAWSVWESIDGSAIGKSNLGTGILFFVLEVGFIVVLLPIVAAWHARTVWRKMAASLVAILKDTINLAIAFEATLWMATFQGGDELYLTDVQREQVETSRNRMIRQLKQMKTDFPRLSIALHPFAGVARAFADSIPDLDQLEAATSDLMKTTARASFKEKYRKEIEPIMSRLIAIRPNDGFRFALDPTIRDVKRAGIKRLVAWARSGV